MFPFAEPGKFADIDDELAQIEGSDVSVSDYRFQVRQAFYFVCIGSVGPYE